MSSNLESPPSAPARVCFTIGDPTGIGPEIAAKFLHRIAANTLEDTHTKIPPNSSLIVLGDIPQLMREAEANALTLPEGEAVTYINVLENSTVRLSSKETLPGKLAHESIRAAVAEIHAGHADVLLTGPISKENLQRAGLPYGGHTEILQDLAQHYYGQPYQSDMLFLHGAFRMLLLTRHVPLRRVSETLSIPGVIQSLDSLCRFLQAHCRLPAPRLCILGVNPHAGELEGQEEELILKPAIATIVRKYGFPIAPPTAADAAFRDFNAKQPGYDAYVAAYHDQGLIPFKMVAGFNAVNVTIGLPFLRTSVSHGTAPDIVGKNLARPDSLIQAYQTALTLAN